jgi:uncharacterized protein YbjT (DUF2867 family)
MGLRLLLTGVTGMVGEGVLNECLLSPDVDEVLVVSRRPTGIEHLKFSEYILPNFFDLSSIGNVLDDFDACFFCLGVSSVGIKKNEYERMTYDLTIGFAKALAQASPGAVFCYVSGAGTDSTEKGRLHWARVKGKTENDLQRLGLSQTFLFRPGILKPTRGLKNTLGFYKWAGWILPVFEFILPNSICSLAQLGQAMIHAVTRGYQKNVLDVKDIKKLSE